MKSAETRDKINDGIVHRNPQIIGNHIKDQEESGFLAKKKTKTSFIIIHSMATWQHLLHCVVG